MGENNDSILRTIKKLLMIADEDPAFDMDILIHINSAIRDLYQIGVGSKPPFVIHGESETWKDFLGDDLDTYQSVKTYIYLKVKMIFDPPTSSSVMDAYQGVIRETEWRLSMQAEGYLDNAEEEGG